MYMKEELTMNKRKPRRKLIERQEVASLKIDDLNLPNDSDHGDDVQGAKDYVENDDQALGEIQKQDDELREALVDYMATGGQDTENRKGRSAWADELDSDDDHERPSGNDDPGSDSSEDERPNKNTVGSVPLEWYKDEDHIGYDIEGQQIARKPRADKLQQLLDRNDSKKALRTIYDEYNDEEITLTREELDLVMRIRRGNFPHVEVDPHEPYNDYFSRHVETMPLSAAPEPKRRFIPSKWEEKKIVKLVRAIRKGWLKTSEQKAAEERTEAPLYLMWGDDGSVAGSDKTAMGLSYIPPPKIKLPGHEESYNPPAEYLPTEEERAAAQLQQDEEGERKLLPTSFSCLRAVPSYAHFIHERFERCLDLYLCPRVRRRHMHIDPESLKPQLPRPSELQPFPTTLAMKFIGHTGRVLSLSPHPSGRWLASSSQDGSVRVWEVSTGRCMAVLQLGAPVACVAWCPAPALSCMLAAAVGSALLLLPVAAVSVDKGAAVQEALESAAQAASASQAASKTPALVEWRLREGGGLELQHGHALRFVSWHARGDYFTSVAPTGNTQAVMVHQLSRGASQNPFRKNKGRMVRTLFHPTQPFLFVATQSAVRVYNLAAQSLTKKLVGSSGVISCMDVHPSGDHVLVGSEDKRLAWYDLDLSPKPYRALRFHAAAIRGAAYHRSYPLFASASDDGTAHVFHGRVFSDLMTNPLIVPVKILRGHSVVNSGGVLDVAFHPTQPWLFTAGADTFVHLYCN